MSKIVLDDLHSVDPDQTPHSERVLIFGHIYSKAIKSIQFEFCIPTRVVFFSLKCFHGFHFCQTSAFENHKGNSFAVIHYGVMSP